MRAHGADGGWAGQQIDNLPQTNVRINKIFAIGGECDERKIGSEVYTHYPRLAVVGEITVL